MIDLLKIIRATEEAAIACYDFIGKGNEKLADKAAVDAMRSCLNQIDFKLYLKTLAKVKGNICSFFIESCKKLKISSL